MMDKLWAPWRSNYVKKVTQKKHSGSVFSKLLKEKKDKKNYIFIRREHSFSILNIFPYNNGHVMVIPNREVADLKDLTKVEREDLFDLVEETKELLEKILKPHGFNIGINLGQAAGAGIPQHLHVHIVPRWNGDVNFMPVTAETKVISQSLSSLYEKLVDAHQKRRRKNRT